jgi:hypothetical protein
MGTSTPPGGGDPLPTPQAVRVRTGIMDSSTSYVEVTEGLKEGDQIISSVKMPLAQVAAAPAGTSPFGGPPRMR